jgi:hypothetical protein
MTDKSNPNDRDLDTTKGRDTNPDPITGAPGSHPVGTGVGAAGVGAAGTWAGAAIGGAVGGPVGAVVGGVAGAVAGAVGGGAAGKAVAENVDPTVEGQYWRDNYTTRNYVERDYDYDTDYAPAYQHGWTSRSQYAGRTFDEAEPTLRTDWERTKGKSRLTWDKAKFAVRDAWDRVSDKVERAVPGDSDRDGK